MARKVAVILLVGMNQRARSEAFCNDFTDDSKKSQENFVRFKADAFKTCLNSGSGRQNGYGLIGKSGLSRFLFVAVFNRKRREEYR